MLSECESCLIRFTARVCSARALEILSGCISLPLQPDAKDVMDLTNHAVGIEI